jgi:hypothetical protein
VAFEIHHTSGHAGIADLKRLVKADCHRLVTLIEDLHWMDAGSEAFLEQLVEGIVGSRSLLIVNFRPGYHATWTAKSYYQQIPLAPLGPEAMRAMLEDLLGHDPRIEGLTQSIYARTGPEDQIRLARAAKLAAVPTGSLDRNRVPSPELDSRRNSTGRDHELSAIAWPVLHFDRRA